MLQASPVGWRVMTAGDRDIPPCVAAAGMPRDAGDEWADGGATAGPCVLVRIRNEDNVRRYYLLDLQDNLFGGVTLVREWGRIGGAGQRRLVFFDERRRAVRALASLARAKVRRGYRPASVDDAFHLGMPATPS